MHTVTRLREPIAWILVVAVAVHLASGLIMLLSSEGRLNGRAISETIMLDLVTSPGLAAVLAAAVALILWQNPGGRGRAVVFAALVIYLVTLLVAGFAWIAGVMVGTETVEIDGREVEVGPLYPGDVKTAALLCGLSKVLILGAGAYFSFAAWQALGSRQLGYQGRHGYGYQQPHPAQQGPAQHAPVPRAPVRQDPYHHQQPYHGQPAQG